MNHKAHEAFSRELIPLEGYQNMDRSVLTGIFSGRKMVNKKNKLIAYIAISSLLLPVASYAEEVIFSNGFEYCFPGNKVHWDGGGDGINWSDLANWEGDMLPRDGDSVSSQTPGIEFLIYDDSLASTTVRCLESIQNLSITGGALSILETGIISSTLKVSAGSLRVTGSLRVADAQDDNIPLLHRWSFNADANDSVGNSNASLTNGATLGGGVVSLDGTNQYVALPIQDTLSILSSSTIEIWMTLDNFSTWTRIFDFGNDWQVNFFATPRGDAGVLRAAITTGGNPTEERVEGVDELPTGVSVHFALTIDSVKHTTVMYVDGSPVGSASWTLDTAALGTLANIWLGRSQYDDPYFHGNFDEVRIYDGALTAQSISQSYASGPDGL